MKKIFKNIFKFMNSRASVVFVALFLLLSFFPTYKFWFDYSRITIDNEVHYQGSPVYISIKRTLERNFYGKWNVTIWKYGETGVEAYCSAGQEQQYNKDAKLPQDKERTLAWWTGFEPGCKGTDLIPGTYYVETCHTVFVPIVLDRTDCIDSNTFTILERPVDSEPFQNQN